MISPAVILMHEVKHISEMIQDLSDFNKRNKLPQLKHQALLNAILKAEKYLR